MRSKGLSSPLSDKTNLSSPTKTFGSPTKTLPSPSKIGYSTRNAANKRVLAALRASQVPRPWDQKLVTRSAMRVSALGPVKRRRLKWQAARAMLSSLEEDEQH